MNGAHGTSSTVGGRPGKKEGGIGNTKQKRPVASSSRLWTMASLVSLIYLASIVIVWTSLSETGSQVKGVGDFLRRSVKIQQDSQWGGSYHGNDGSNTLTAYLEPIYQSDWQTKPLPARNSTASVLQPWRYPSVNSCSKLPEQWPIDETSPTDIDPFLPWIHDVFPTADGKFIQFVAQNKRRCNSGKQFAELKNHLQPNIALFQHVPVKRIQTDGAGSTPRYRLSSHEEADPDGIETRFICRFKPSMQETLSVYNFNYDWHSKRKGYKYTFTEEGFDVHMIWSSQFVFKCPVPENLVETVRSGSSVINDYATMFVDLVPIRTPPRYGYPNQFLPPKYDRPYTFIAEEEWGDSHVLPRIEDSGRWENVPICKTSLQTYVDSPDGIENEHSDSKALLPTDNADNNAALSEQKDEGAAEKRYELISCVWTSASFHTRGEKRHITDNVRRLREWLEFHLMTGFDHVFVYDNSGATSTSDHPGSDSESLKPITDLFPGQVTRINWPCKVCNNRPGSGDNKGERSSQYAAESSCRLRFGVHAEWIGAFDIDEYMVPMGGHDNMKDVIAAMYSRGTKILNFKSQRSWPRRELLDNPGDPNVREENTFLQTYNCDQEKPPRRNTLPAEKQIYKADYVLLHFVHYSTVTTASVLSKEETEEAGLRWKDRYGEAAVDFPEEQTEAKMLHSKTVTSEDTENWQKDCAKNEYYPIYKELSKGQMRGSQNSCRIGIPFPPGKDQGNGTGPILKDADGYTCNCFISEKIESHYIPLLEEALRKRGQATII